MNQDVADDLKQFITVTVSQQVATLRDDLKVGLNKLDKKIDRVEVKVDSLSASVAEALDASNEAIARQIKNHERRIMRLERKAA